MAAPQSIATKMPPPACPGCRHPETRLRWHAGDRLFRTTDERFDLHRCDACAMTFLWPVPDAETLAAYYPEGYWVGAAEEDGGGSHGRLVDTYRRFVLRDHVRFVGRAIESRRAAGHASVDVLDVGCGDGSFLEALDHTPCAGLDVSADAAARAGARGLDVRVGTPDAAEGTPFGDRRFDVVTMFHFLEHVSPAGPTLAGVRRLLADEGELVVQVPNADSYQARLLGRHWAGYDVPRHLVNYTPATLRRCLEEAGFEVLEISHHSLRDNPTTLANSLTPGLYPPARVATGVGQGGLASVLYDFGYLAVTLLSMPAALLESVLGHGASIMVRARVGA